MQLVAAIIICLIALAVVTHDMLLNRKYRRLQREADGEPTHDETGRPLPPHGQIELSGLSAGVRYRLPRRLMKAR